LPLSNQIRLGLKGEQLHQTSLSRFWRALFLFVQASRKARVTLEKSTKKVQSAYRTENWARMRQQVVSIFICLIIISSSRLPFFSPPPESLQKRNRADLEADRIENNKLQSEMHAHVRLYPATNPDIPILISFCSSLAISFLDQS
jgi:hypothetical protein